MTTHERDAAGDVDVSGGTRPTTTYLIGRLDRIVRRSLDERLREFGLTALGYTALTVLEARPGLSNAQLARRSFMTPQGMNQVITALAEKGYVERTPSVDNLRIRQIRLTEHGAWVVAQCSIRADDYEQGLLASLTDTERYHLNALLRTIVNANRGRP